MGLKKGQTNNWRGRPKGAKNKSTGQLRELITLFLENNFGNAMADLRRLPAKDRLKFYIELMPYALPKLQSTDMHIDFDRLPDDQLDQMIEKVISAAVKTNQE